MFAQHPYSIAARLLAILAVALAFVVVLASSAAQPASADDSQWTRSQPHWWDNSNGWHKPWRKSWDRSWHKPRHHRHHFHSSRPRIIIGTPGFVFSSPGIIVTRPRILTNPGFVVRQPGFVVRDPRFAFDRPGFVVRHKHFFKHRGFKHRDFHHGDFQHGDFFKRHPSLGHHWAHKAWKRQHWRHPGIGHLPGAHGGIRFIRPGMH